jgi:hypothetical protein
MDEWMEAKIALTGGCHKGQPCFTPGKQWGIFENAMCHHLGALRPNTEDPGPPWCFLYNIEVDLTNCK